MGASGSGVVLDSGTAVNGFIRHNTLDTGGFHASTLSIPANIDPGHSYLHQPCLQLLNAKKDPSKSNTGALPMQQD